MLEKDFSYNTNSREYLNWILSILDSEPTQMITEQTYSKILENATHEEKKKISELYNFASSLNNYAIENCIKNNVSIHNDLEYHTHFSLVLKVDERFLLISYESSAYCSYVFVAPFNNTDNIDFIDAELYLQNKRPLKIEKTISQLELLTEQLNNQITDFVNSDSFKDLDFSNEDKEYLIKKFVLDKLCLNNN